jgi:hypothetical protein
VFECKGCKAKDKEIDHLLALTDSLQRQNEAMQKRLLEIADPGSNRRVETAARPARAQVLRPRREAYPGEERRRAPGIEVE